MGAYLLNMLYARRAIELLLFAGRGAFCHEVEAAAMEQCETPPARQVTRAKKCHQASGSALGRLYEADGNCFQLIAQFCGLPPIFAKNWQVVCEASKNLQVHVRDPKPVFPPLKVAKPRIKSGSRRSRSD